MLREIRSDRQVAHRDGDRLGDELRQMLLHGHAVGCLKQILDVPLHGQIHIPPFSSNKKTPRLIYSPGAGMTKKMSDAFRLRVEAVA